jgi:outer membrane receptor for ferrienterochelin and colicin
MKVTNAGINWASIGWIWLGWQCSMAIANPVEPPPAPDPNPTATKPVEEVPDLEIDVIARPLTVKQERLTAPVGKIILDRSDLQRYNRVTVGEVLRRQPGVFFGGAPGEDKDVRLLGIPKEYTQVLIDGLRFPDGGENREFRVDRIPVDLVERIEIITNPTALQNSQGIAGTVNIVLKRTANRRFAQITANGGILESGSGIGGASVLYGDRIDNFSYILSGSIQRRNSPKEKDKITFNAAGVPTATEREREQKPITDIALAPRLSWQLSPQTNFYINPTYLRNSEDKDKTKAVLNAANVTTQNVVERENKIISGGRIQTGIDHTLSPTAKLNVSLLYQRTDENKDKTETTDRLSTTGALTGRTLKVETERKYENGFLASTQLNWRTSPNNLLTLGVEGDWRGRNKDKFVTNQTLLPTVGSTTPAAPGVKDLYDLRESQYNVIIQNELVLGPQHTLTAGARIETANNQARSGTNVAAGTIAQTGTAVNPSLHYRYELDPRTVLRASVANTLRRPKFDDLIPFVDSKSGSLISPDVIGNPNLQPEKSFNVEVGAQHLWGNGNNLIGVNLFHHSIANKIENDITLNPANNRFQQSPRNVGDGRLYGVIVDSQTRGNFIGLPNLTLLANASFFGSEVLDLRTNQRRVFKEQPNYVANLGFDYAIPDWRLNFGLNYTLVPTLNFVERKEDGNVETVSQGGLNSLDVYLAYRLSDSMALRLYGNNLLAARKDKTVSTSNSAGVFQNRRTELEESERFYGVSLQWNF